MTTKTIAALMRRHQIPAEDHETLEQLLERLDHELRRLRQDRDRRGRALAHIEAILPAEHATELGKVIQRTLRPCSGSGDTETVDLLQKPLRPTGSMGSST